MKIYILAVLSAILLMSGFSKGKEGDGFKKIKNQSAKSSNVDISDDTSYTHSKLKWPVITGNEMRPWTWWWWHGAAVSKAEITRSLQEMHQSGIGGVCIVCLLDVNEKGVTKLRFLSKEWIETVAYTVKETRSLGMGVDMSPVSGWGFGGSRVKHGDESGVIHSTILTLDECREKGWRILNRKKDGSGEYSEDISAVMAFSSKGKTIDLTGKISEEGILDWSAPSEGWKLYIVKNHRGATPSRMSTPGYRGPAVDHLSAPALMRYFGHFDKAFAHIDKADLPRAFMNDSWETYMDWTRNFFTEFEERRGYDLRQHLPAFMGQGDKDKVSRVVCDYRHTLSDLMLDNFTNTFSQWASGHGSQIIGETINEPANELDLNALYNIPQADMGGARSWFISKGDYVSDNAFMRAKIPASVVHILGKPLVGSESLTCLGPLFDTPYDLMKEKLDYDIISGVNHIAFHGMSYSPSNVHWPGWLFYAGTHLGSFNPIWNLGGKQFCDYITRIQSFMQAGKPDSDLLVYDPIFDQWSKRFSDSLMVPKVVSTFSNLPPYSKRVPAMHSLWRAGYGFDLVSDRLLESIHAEDGKLVSPGTSYNAIVVTNCKLMSVATIEKIVDLATAGATIIMHGQLPQDVPGFSRLQERRIRFQAALGKIVSARDMAVDKKIASLGIGRIVFGDDILASMDKAGIYREKMMDASLRYIRRKDDQSTTYFITNLAEGKRVDGWVPLTAIGASAVIFDPMTGRTGVGEYRKDSGNIGSAVRLQLDPRQSCIVRVF
ncbi:MAG: hypothetical protein HOC82_03945, partial [Bacteroidetes bacterium]|nr:hypothetical protein [Bacteroidota bacterium]